LQRNLQQNQHLGVGETTWGVRTGSLPVLQLNDRPSNDKFGMGTYLI